MVSDELKKTIGQVRIYILPASYIWLDLDDNESAAFRFRIRRHRAERVHCQANTGLSRWVCYLSLQAPFHAIEACLEISSSSSVTS